LELTRISNELEEQCDLESRSLLLEKISDFVDTDLQHGELATSDVSDENNQSKHTDGQNNNDVHYVANENGMYSDDRYYNGGLYLDDDRYYDQGGKNDDGANREEDEDETDVCFIPPYERPVSSYATTSALTPGEEELLIADEKEVYEKAMQVFCDLNSRKAFHPDYVWPVLTQLKGASPVTE